MLALGRGPWCDSHCRVREHSVIASKQRHSFLRNLGLFVRCKRIPRRRTKTYSYLWIVIAAPTTNLWHPTKTIKMNWRKRIQPWIKEFLKVCEWIRCYKTYAMLWEILFFLSFLWVIELKTLSEIKLCQIWGILITSYFVSNSDFRESWHFKALVFTFCASILTPHYTVETVWFSRFNEDDWMQYRCQISCR